MNAEGDCITIYFYCKIRADEDLVNPIIGSGPAWGYSTSAGVLYINGLQWVKTDYLDGANKATFAPVGNNGGLVADVSSTEPGPVSGLKTWKLTKTGTANQWHGWQSSYNGTFNSKAGDIWTITGYYKTINAAGATKLLAGGFSKPGWTGNYSTKVLESSLNIVADGNWHYFYCKIRVDEDMTNPILVDGPCWNYSTSAGVMYINGLQWVKTNYNKDNWTYTWEEGRQLASVSGNGYTLNFKYDDAGIRTQKTVNGISTNYHLIGDKVAFETNGTDNIYYTYGSGDKLVSMNLNGVEYYYIRNGQGDIIGLFDGAGSQVVSYSYDTWGKLLSVSASLASTVGQKNPYRYRGYRYDTETGLYYLQSRYYNPEWGRFMNADTTDILEALTNTEDDLLDVNLFAYCLNNPVNYSDPDGYCAILAGAYFIPGVGQALLVATVAVVAIVVVSYAAVKAGQYIGENISEAREKKAKKKKEAKKSQKETATDAPSWAKHEKPLKDETAEKFTKRILNDKYGEGKWKKGAGTEYSEIIKYATRKLGLK